MSTEFTDKYKYSILAVCEEIHSSYTGSGDRLPEKTLVEYHRWLERRLFQVWDPTTIGKNSAYENAVRQLAMAAHEEAYLQIQQNESSQ